MEKETPQIESDVPLIINSVPSEASKTADDVQNQRFDEYMTPEFTQRLLEHINRAVKAALRDAEEFSNE
jgi:hypothetical protein